MKHSFTGFLALIMTFGVSAQVSKVDSVAILILDQMSHVIGDLTSASFTVETRNDVNDPDVGLTSHFAVNEVYFDGPDKMLVNLKGDKGHRGYWYNGDVLVFYSYNENNYAVIDAPSTTLETIDSVYSTYGIDFPAADFFYPTFTDDLLANSNEIVFDGIRVIDGKECFHIITKGKEETIQFWISNNVFYTPVKMLIMKNNSNLQYEATFSNWQFNQVLPVSMFEFVAPPKAREISILPKK